MGSGVSRVMTGSFTGTGAIVNVKTVGFKPKRVELFNLTGLAKGMWQEGMADDSVMKQVTAGTISAPTTDGVTPLADGFALGADADLNVAAEQVFWTAFE